MNENFYGACGRVESAKWPFFKAKSKYYRKKEADVVNVDESDVETRAWPLYNTLIIGTAPEYIYSTLLYSHKYILEPFHYASAKTRINLEIDDNYIRQRSKRGRRRRLPLTATGKHAVFEQLVCDDND